MLELFATCPRGVEDLLVDELTALGGQSVRATTAGVRFRGELETAMAACLWSRTASRILLPLARFDIAGAEDLYQGVASIAWEDHLDPDGTMAVDASGSSDIMGHSGFVSLKTKDAVVDRLRGRFGRRPSVDARNPDLGVNVHLRGSVATVSLDLSGTLHRRGYRREKGEAPLKENLAAAILLRAGWPEMTRQGAPFLDPMCGSGTLPIEAALMAADIAPGLGRSRFGFSGWLGFDKAVWTRLQVEARYRREEGLARMTLIAGSDRDGRALRMARDNAARAGFAERISFSRKDVAGISPPDRRGGLLVVNPPYGERMGAQGDLADLYGALGGVLRERFTGWRAAVFTGSPELGRELGMRAVKTNTLYNGPIKCRLLQFQVEKEYFYRELQGIGKDRETANAGRRAGSGNTAGKGGPRSGDAAMFANRLRKNVRTIGRWAGREGLECYRLYDADIPEYNLTVEVYGDQVHMAEYQAPYQVPEETARRHLQEAVETVREVLDVPEDNLHLKLRRRQKGLSQYGRQAETRRFFQVSEGGYRFLVNLDDYLDTGLFLDHRLTRHLIGDLAAGRRFLNLFAYTGSATVYAAGGGAAGTTTIDLSNTYLDWARRNLELNGQGGKGHRFLRADCVRWLEEAAGAGERYGLVFLDPPTYSTSKAMDGDMDLQRDHARLIHRAASLLDMDGVMIFSTNRRDFVMDTESLSDLVVREITGKTLPRDFTRRPPAHRSFRIERKIRHCRPDSRQ